MKLYAPYENSITIGQWSGCRTLHREDGSSVHGVLIAPSIHDVFFDGIEALRLYDLHRNALKVGTVSMYCETKRDNWKKGIELPS